MTYSYLYSAGVFVQLALLCHVLGFLARNELVLRGFLLAGTTLYILYYYFISDAPLWDAIWASSVIGSVNLSMICIILRERSTIGMSAKLLELYREFPTLNPGQFRKLMKHADWVTVSEKSQICTRGIKPDHLYLVSSGRVTLHRDGKFMSVSSGSFIGEISFLLDCPATSDVFAVAGTSYVCWDCQDLHGMMHKSARLSNAVSALFNKDMARKLAISWDATGLMPCPKDLT